MASAVKLVQLSAAVVLGLLLCETAVAARPSASTFGGGLSAVAHGRGLLGVRPAADLNGNSCLDCSEALACMVPSTACDRSGANYVLRVNLSNCKVRSYTLRVTNIARGNLPPVVFCTARP